MNELAADTNPGRQRWMRYGTRSPVCWSLPFLILSSACCAQPECDSIEARKAVLELMSGDSQNPLVDYAIRNSSADRGARDTKAAAADSKKHAEAKPLYELGQRMVVTSTSKDKSTVKCSGAISVSVGDIKATKELNYTVQQSSDGKLSVSVEPFQF